MIQILKDSGYPNLFGIKFENDSIKTDRMNITREQLVSFAAGDTNSFLNIELSEIEKAELIKQVNML